MAACPNGHDSADTEFCDVCGMEMSAAPAAPQPRPAPEASAASVCPACDTPLDGRFCEACGHDSLAAPPARTPRPAPAPDAPPPPAGAPAPPPTPTWTATVSADRTHFDTVMAAGGPDAADITFPPFCPERYFPLHAKQITIGRRSTSRGIHPDIDLTGPPEDPGVSHLHAVLLVGPAGDLSIVDVGSANGTTVNDSQDALPTNVPRPLADGDRVHIGAWTTITVRLTE